MIRSVKESDARAICNIYNKYIEETTITFEEIPLKESEIISRIKVVTQNYPWLVFEENEKVIGYSYAGKWKERAAYRHSVEIAIYLNSENVGKGIGSLLLRELLKELKELKDNSIHAVIYGVALPNPASIALCNKLGFQKIAHLKEVGYKFEKWIDVGYWELII